MMEKNNLMLVYKRMAEVMLAKRTWASTEKGQPIGPSSDALEYIDKALRLAKELNTELGEAGCYHVYAKIFGAGNDWQSAEEYFKKAIERYEKLKNKILLGDACFDYGLMLKKGEQQGACPSGMANDYLARALKIYQDLKLSHKIKEIETRL